ANGPTGSDQWDLVLGRSFFGFFATVEASTGCGSVVVCSLTGGDRGYEEATGGAFSLIAMTLGYAAHPEFRRCRALPREARMASQPKDAAVKARLEDSRPQPTSSPPKTICPWR